MLLRLHCHNIASSLGPNQFLLYTCRPYKASEKKLYVWNPGNKAINVTLHKESLKNLLLISLSVSNNSCKIVVKHSNGYV